MSNTRPDFALNPMAALVVAYNTIAGHLSQAPVNKFSDKPTAVKRLNAILDDAVARHYEISYLPNGAIDTVTFAPESETPQADAIRSAVADAQKRMVDLGAQIIPNSPTPSDIEEHVRKTAVPGGVIERPAVATGSVTNSTLDLAQKIEVLVANPKRKGSRSHKVWDVYTTGMTGEEYVAKMVKLGYGRRLALAALHWDLDYGFINMS